MNYFVTAIDTDSGKTLTSAILCEALQADYWKPVQAGLPRDSDTVRSLLSNNVTRIHPETYLLQMPASPHAAARAEGIAIDPGAIELPQTSNHLVIEGAGGCLVPLNDNYFIIDLIQKLAAQVVLVSDIYLGSINHTLLTAEALRKRNIEPAGIVFNGDANEETERIILKHSGYKKLLHIRREPVVDALTVKKYATTLLKILQDGPR